MALFVPTTLAAPVDCWSHRPAVHSAPLRRAENEVPRSCPGAAGPSWFETFLLTVCGFGLLYVVFVNFLGKEAVAT